MSFFALILISLALSMDSVAVTLSLSAYLKNEKIIRNIRLPIIFGISQALMPLIGFYAGINFYELIKNYDHWLVFAILFILGVKMIIDAFNNKNEVKKYNKLSYGVIISLGFATSIDALAIGLSFALLKVNIFYAILCIGVITFLLSFIAMFAGKHMATKINLMFIGGIILIALAIKILIEHLF